MFLSKELIVAVRASCWRAKRDFVNRSTTRYQTEPKAIADFMRKNPDARAQINANRAIIRKASKAIAKAQKEISSFGIDAGLGFITSAKDFAKGGGVPIIELPRPERVESVLARLAQCTGKEGREIIRQLGINWS